MGYDKTDELAVNTIRTLAVSLYPPPSSSAVGRWLVAAPKSMEWNGVVDMS